jgi:hypothetical protein
MKDNFITWQIEDDINIFTNGRQPQYFPPMAENHNIFFKMEDDLNSFANGRQS